MSEPVPFESLLLTLEQAARMLSISPRTLARMTAAGDVKAVRFGRAVRYDRRELERAVQQAQQPQPKSAG